MSLIHGAVRVFNISGYRFPRHKAVLSALVCFSLVMQALAQTVFLDFNTPRQYTNNFNPWEDVGGANGGNYSFQEGSTVGVGGSGGVSVFQNNDTTAVYNGSGWNFSSSGATVIVSTVFKANSQANTANKIQLGVMNSDTNGLNPNTGVAFATFRLIPQSVGVWGLHEQYRTAGTSIDTLLNTVNFTPGRWYKFVVAVTNTAGSAGSYTAGAALYDYGTDGLTPGTNIVTFPTARSHTGQPDVTVSPVWPALRAFQNAGIDSWDDFLVCTPASPPTITLPLASATALTGSPVPFHALADGPGALSTSWYTNGILDGTAFGWTYLTPPLDPGYSNIEFVASNNNGSVTNLVAITVIIPSPAIVTNLPASGVQATWATLNGQVVSTGNDTPAITVFYGPMDGGTDPASWAQSISLGLQSGTFAQTVMGLSPGTTYYFSAQATNRAGLSWATPSQSFTTALSNSVPPLISVLTYHYDNARTGQNTNETTLTPANVNTTNFGLLFSYPVDGQVYAEPLYLAGAIFPGQGTHNVVFVATQHNSVYAFDADSNAGPNGGLLWQVNLGTSAVTPNNDFGNRYGLYSDISPEVGITSTPVIDPVSGTIYVDALTHEGRSYFHRIHALNITNGSEQPNSPVVVTASVPGAGLDSVSNVVTFNPTQQLQRSALTLAGGMLYVAYCGYADTDPYHGWVIGFNASTLQQVTNYVFNTTPNATVATFGSHPAEGGIWMSGNGLAVDADTNLYFEVGNGSFNANTNGGTEYGDSFVKLSSFAGLSVADFFTPHNQAILAVNDEDLGSGGPVLLPDSVGTPAHPHLMVGCGKEGKIYLLDRDNLGHFNSVADTNIIQALPGAIGNAWSSGAYFNNLIYYQGAGDVMKSFRITNGLLSATPVSRSSTSFAFPGATPVISANGTNNAIAWALQTDGYPGGAGILHAYNAYNLSQELYNSSMAGTRDIPGGAIKFTVPTVANGKVYVGTAGSLSIFGNVSFGPFLVISPASLSFGGVVIGQTNQLSFQLVNGGRQTLSGTAAAADAFSIISGSPFNLAPGQTGQLLVTFSPGSVINYSNVVTFTSNGGNSLNTVTGSGLTPARVAVSPAVLDFGVTAVGLNVQASLVVTNLGEAALNNGSAIVDAGPFAILSGTPFTLPGGGTTNIVVQFAPANEGSFSNNVLVTTGNAGNSTNGLLGSGALVPAANFVGNPTSGLVPLTVSFTDNSTGTITNRFWDFGDGSTTNATGTNVIHTYTAAGTNTVTLIVSGPVGTDTQMRAGYVVVTNSPPQLLLNPASLNFGAVIIGQTNQLSFQVVNSGGQTLSGTAAAADPFGIIGGSPFNLAPGQTGQVLVAFSPTAAVNYSNMVTFTGNGGNSLNIVIGSGLTPAQLAVSPSVLDFGVVAVGTNAQASLVVTNLGQAALTNGSAMVGGGPFSILSGTPFNLLGGGTTNIVVQFAPASEGSFSNYVAITTDNGGNNTNGLTGSGAVVPVASFIGTPTSGAAPLTVSFTDSSTGTITNRFWDWGDGATTNTALVSLVHTYNVPGTNTVALTVMGPLGTNQLNVPGYIVVTNLGPIIITIAGLTNQVQLTWPLGTLQSADSVAGIYTDVTNAVSPYIVPVSSGVQFYRVHVR